MKEERIIKKVDLGRMTRGKEEEEAGWLSSRTAVIRVGFWQPLESLRLLIKKRGKWPSDRTTPN